MKCPFCFSETRVIDKRESEELGANRRRRECLKCSKRFTTYERIETPSLTVIKKDGRREDFNSEKVKVGIVKACEKRPVSREQIEELVDVVESELRKKDSTEIQSTVIGDIIMERLRCLDKVAYIRFASVYREFGDIKSFEKELEKLLKG
jgi:transcriptional repressor NrdR